MNVLAELQRRNVHRAAVFYAGAAWLLMQVATQVFPVFDIPNSTVRIVVIAAVVGFPFAMALSWFYEWTPQSLIELWDKLGSPDECQRRERGDYVCE